MDLDRLSEEEKTVVGQALRAAAAMDPSSRTGSFTRSSAWSVARSALSTTHLSGQGTHELLLRSVSHGIVLRFDKPHQATTGL